MLRTRLWMGALLIALAALVLLEDRRFAPWYPFLGVAAIAACCLGARELLRMLDQASRPSRALCQLGVAAVIVANWQQPLGIPIDTWRLIGLVFVCTGIAAFVIEMWRFRGPDRIAERIAQTLLVVFYLGILPSFLLQLRWLPQHSTLALALTVFVPKGNDIGAYFTGKFLTGRVLGRHPMTPRLSPKKTWQGAVGGMLASCGVAVGFGGPLLASTWAALGFGLAVGLAGVFGDLAESLLKRDRQAKDASASIPGFGGVLDVIDSLLFAAPVSYCWLSCQGT
jgi:phosphatidate cytidylyltransferase